MPVYSKPVYVKKVNERIGTKALAKAIGCSTGTIWQAIREDKISVFYEMAAELVFRRDNPDGNKCVIIHAPSHACKTIEEMVTALGGRFHAVP